MLDAVDSDLLLSFASQFLNPGLEISGSGEVQAAAKAVIDEMRALLAEKKATVLEAVPGLDARQVMPGDIIHFPSTLYENYSLYEICRQLSFSLLLPVWKSRIYSVNPNTLLTHESGRGGVSVQRSRNSHEKAGNGKFAFKNFQEREVIGHTTGRWLMEAFKTRCN